MLNELKGRSLTPQERLKIPQQAMPCQSPAARAANMAEAALGYSEEQAQAEALRCLQCKTAPCIKGCPVGVNIPAFISRLQEKDAKAALSIIKEANMLPAMCGRVCPQEKQCMAQCAVGKALKDPMQAVAIGRLERFAADQEKRAAAGPMPASQNAGARKKRVAIAGSGPSGLAAAAELAKAGFYVEVLEAFHKAGGVAVYGIPEFRLPKRIVEEETAALQSLGVVFRTDFLVGRTRAVQELLEQDGFDAVYLAVGAGLPKFLGIPGENLAGVLSANEYLTRNNLMKAYDNQALTPILRGKRVAVLGGGNVAMDASRTAIRLGAQSVSIVYRRTEQELPARAEEIAHAKEEGVQFQLLAQPVAIVSDAKGWAAGVRCLRCRLGEPDASGRRAPQEIAGSEFVLEADLVIPAIGNSSNPLVKQTLPQLAVDRRGNIAADAEGRTNIPRVYAGGDIVLGAATVILAMGQGRKAAKAIIQDLTGEPQ